MMKGAMRYIRFKQQVHAYRHDIYRFALHLLGNTQDAEDAAQDVLIRFWDHFDAIHADKYKTWLMTTTHHKCIDTIRRRRPIPDWPCENPIWKKRARI